jgi:hypothetical protein
MFTVPRRIDRLGESDDFLHPVDVFQLVFREKIPSKAIGQTPRVRVIEQQLN